MSNRNKVKKEIENNVNTVPNHQDNKEDKPMEKEKHGIAKRLGRGIGSAFNWMRAFPDRHPVIADGVETTLMAFGIGAGTVIGVYTGSQLIDEVIEKKRKGYTSTTSMPIPGKEIETKTVVDLPVNQVSVAVGDIDAGFQKLDNIPDGTYGNGIEVKHF